MWNAWPNVNGAIVFVTEFRVPPTLIWNLSWLMFVAWIQDMLRSLVLSRPNWKIRDQFWMFSCVAQVSMVKALAGDLVNQVLYDCVQFHGGMGFVRETAVERMARDARVQAIGGGASEVMLEEIAKRFGAALVN